MIVSITGGTGFVGRKLVEKCLAAGHKVRVLSRYPDKKTNFSSDIEWYTNDIIAGYKDLIPFVEGSDVLIHCAAEIRDQAKMQEINVDGTKNLLQAATGRVKHWVQLSSIAVYGILKEGVVTENTILLSGKFGEYDTSNSKAKAEQIVIETAKLAGFSYTILRPSKIFGVGSKDNTLIQLIKLIDSNLFFHIGQPGAIVTYVHVDNVIDALMQSMERTEAKNEIFNLSQNCEVEEFTSIIAKALGKKPPKCRLPKLIPNLIATATDWIPGNPLTRKRLEAMVNRTIYDSNHIEKVLGYKFNMTLKQGINMVVKDYKDIVKNH